MIRKHTTLLPPPTIPATLPHHKLWMVDGKPSLRILQAHLFNEGRLELNDLKRILILAGGLFEEEPNLLKLRSPINVLGDIHGQFYDLYNILMKITDSPSESPFLFLGDYVDRGYFSVETIIYLFALKIHYPDSVFLLRGNHETRAMTSIFNFKQEVLKKYKSEHIYSFFMKTFDKLPISAVVDDSWFCCHGGLSPDLLKLENIENINRFTEPSSNGLMCDLMWSDFYRPSKSDKNKNKKEDKKEEEKEEPNWKENKMRGCSYMYNEAALDSFLNNNKLKGVIRAHEVCKNGFSIDWFKDANNSIPKHVTIFSAPNYCDVYKNLGAYLRIEKEGCICENVKESLHCDLGAAYHDVGLTFVTFKEVEHPYCLPKFQNAFDISYSFIASKLTEAAEKLNGKFESYKSLMETKKMLEEDKIKKKAEIKGAGLIGRKGGNVRYVEEMEFEEIKRIGEENEIVEAGDFKSFSEMSEPSSIDSISKSLEDK